MAARLTRPRGRGRVPKRPNARVWPKRPNHLEIWHERRHTRSASRPTRWLAARSLARRDRRSCIVFFLSHHPPLGGSRVSPRARPEHHYVCHTPIGIYCQLYVSSSDTTSSTTSEPRAKRATKQILHWLVNLEGCLLGGHWSGPHMSKSTHQESPVMSAHTRTPAAAFCR